MRRDPFPEREGGLELSKPCARWRVGETVRAVAGLGRNLAFDPPDVLHSCYKYNYISPSIGWGITRLCIGSRFGGM
jgi:hypothetical protein